MAVSFVFFYSVAQILIGRKIVLACWKDLIRQNHTSQKHWLKQTWSDWSDCVNDIQKCVGIFTFLWYFVDWLWMEKSVKCTVQKMLLESPIRKKMLVFCILWWLRLFTRVLCASGNYLQEYKICAACICVWSIFFSFSGCWHGFCTNEKIWLQCKLLGIKRQPKKKTKSHKTEICLCVCVHHHRVWNGAAAIATAEICWLFVCFIYYMLLCIFFHFFFILVLLAGLSQRLCVCVCVLMRFAFSARMYLNKTKYS